jgi:ABC-type glutathione transport system ATPase component
MDPEDPGRSSDGRDGGRPGPGTTPPHSAPADATSPDPAHAASPNPPHAAPPDPPHATPPDTAHATPPDTAHATLPGPAPADAASPGPAPPESAAGQAPGGDEDRGGGAPGAAVPLLSLQGAAKSFGAVHAIVDASIDLYGGEVHALVGENGAGKSTLVKILAGVHRPDTGQLLVNGTPTVLHGPAAAQDAGIAVIYQEPTLFPDLTAAENIFMGRQPLRRGRRIDARQMRAQARALFGRLGVRLDPGRICRGLSIADQQIIEIAKRCRSKRGSS